MSEEKTPAEEMLTAIDEAYHELRYQCFHACRWKSKIEMPIQPYGGTGVAKRDHLPLDSDKPWKHVKVCGFESAGTTLGVVLRKFSITNSL